MISRSLKKNRPIRKYEHKTNVTQTASQDKGFNKKTMLQLQRRRMSFTRLSLSADDYVFTYL